MQERQFTLRSDTISNKFELGEGRKRLSGAAYHKVADKKDNKLIKKVPKM